MNVDHEIKLLVREMKRLGEKQDDGSVTVPFGVLFKDDKCANIFEALVGTLKAAKKRGVVSYKPQLLLSPMNDADVITLKGDHIDDDAGAAE